MTVICLASGIKGFRYKWTMWSGSRSNLETDDDVKSFLFNPEVQMAFKSYVKAMVREFNSPCVVWELINEPHALTKYEKRYKQWINEIVNFLVQLGVPKKRIMIEASGKSLDLDILERHNHFLYSYHGINTAWAFDRFHLSGCEMEEHFYKPYGRRIIADSDGAQTWADRLIGKGLRGYSWNKDFSRPSSKDMEEGLKKDFKKGGGGWIIMSAAAWVDKTTVPKVSRWKKIALEGLTKAETKRYGVSWEDNKEGELAAIRQAAKFVEKRISMANQ